MKLMVLQINHNHTERDGEEKNKTTQLLDTVFLLHTMRLKTKRTVHKYCMLAIKFGSLTDVISKSETMCMLELNKLIQVV